MFQRLSLVLVSNIMMLYSVRPMRKLPGWTSGQVSSPPNRQPAHTTDLLSSAQLLQTINIPKTSVVDPDLKRLNDIFFACSTNMIVNIFLNTPVKKGTGIVFAWIDSDPYRNSKVRSRSGSVRLLKKKQDPDPYKYKKIHITGQQARMLLVSFM